MQGASLVLCFILFLAGSGFGREIRVEEVLISLHNKPVTGYRVLLDRGKKTVESGIMEHVRRQDQVDPFRYDQSVIFEHIRYPSITNEQPITLYFLLKERPGQLTELIYIAMYDYRRSVNSREFPEMSLRLQADLARIVRQVTGDILKNDGIIFDDEALKNLDRYSEPKEELIEHFAEEEVENNGVLMREDPFQASRSSNKSGELNSRPPIAASQQNGDLEIQRLRSKIKALELREAQLDRQLKRLEGDQAILQRSNEQLQARLAIGQDLQDSITALNTQVESLMRSYYPSDEFSVSSESAIEMDNLMRRMLGLENAYARLQKENDSLIERTDDLTRLLNMTSIGTRERARELRQLKRTNRELEEELSEVKGVVRDAATDPERYDAERDSLIQVINRQQEQQDALAVRLREVRQADRSSEGDLEELKSQLEELRQQNFELDQENMRLRSRAAQLEIATETEDSGIRDSLRLMRLQISRLKQSGNQNEALLSKLQTLELSEQKSKRQLQSLGQELRKIEASEQALTTERDQLKGKIVGVEERLSETQKSLTRKVNEADLAEARAVKAEASEQELVGRIEELKQRQNSLSDSLKATNRRLVEVVGDRSKKEQELEAERANNRALNQTLADIKIDNNRMAERILDLEYTVDSLARYSIPSDDQGQFIREQWTKLQSWERELKEQEAESLKREKLVSQRENFLQGRESELERWEKRLQDSEDRDIQRKLEQSRSGGRNVGEDKIEVKDGTLLVAGASVPVFIAESRQTPPNAIQDRIQNWFAERGEIPVETGANLTYRNARIAELGTQPWLIEIRTSRWNGGARVQISFQSEDEMYIGPEFDRATQAMARELVTSMVQP